MVNFCEKIAINQGAVSRKCLLASVPNGASASSHSFEARCSYSARSSSSAAILIFRLVSVLFTATKCHGCMFAPLGAVAAVATAFFIISAGTSCELKSLTVLRVSINERNEADCSNISSFEGAVYSSLLKHLRLAIYLLAFMQQSSHMITIHSLLRLIRN